MTTETFNPRSLALTILGDVLTRGKFASERLDYHFEKKNLGERDRAFLTQLIYGILREKGFLDHVLAQAIPSFPKQMFLQNLLRLGAYQIIFMEGVADHAALFETVEIAKKKSGATLAKFVNAVLRKILKDAEGAQDQRNRVLQKLSQDPSVNKEDLKKLSWAMSLPFWILERWAGRYTPDQLLDLGTRLQNIPPLDLRVNLSRLSRDEMVTAIESAGLGAKPLGEGPMIRLEKAPASVVRELTTEGKVSLQDFGSYAVVEGLAATPQEVGLDACAGHGGKAAGICEKSGGQSQVFVHDTNPQKIPALVENFSRLGLVSPKILKGPSEAKKMGLNFDWILVDAPCSGMGTMGRKPEIRWRVKPQDLKKHAELQKEIIGQWIPFLKPGGRLLYSVCSLEPEEGVQIIEAVQKTFPALSLSRTQQTFPGTITQDGFFMAWLIRKR